MDVHVPLAITRGLRRRGIDVLTAQEDGTGELSDPELLDRVAQLNRILFTRDRDFLAETVRRLRAHEKFPTVIYAHQFEASIGQCINDLEIIAQAATLEETWNQLVFLPLNHMET